MLTFITFNDRIRYKHYREILIMSKYYSINKFSKILGVSAQTLRNWDAMVNFILTILLVMDTDIILMNS